MLSLSKVLLPVDFSDRCLRMATYAKAVATTYGSELTLLHVVNPVYSIPATAISAPAMIPIPHMVIAEHDKRLESFAAGELAGVPVKRLVYEGEPADQIAGFVNSENVSLVVMPTHGFGVLRRFLLGSVSAKILHDVACPVLTGVHLDPHHNGSPRFTNVLCAIDLTPHNEDTLAWAAQFAADNNAQFGVITAVQDEAHVENAARELGTLQSRLGLQPGPIHVPVGSPAGAVCDFAKSHGADLLIIGRGRRVEESGTLTTNAYAIIRQSPCPVISV